MVLAVRLAHTCNRRSEHQNEASLKERFPGYVGRGWQSAYLKQVEAASVADKLQNSRALLRRLTEQAQQGGGVVTSI